MKVVLNKGAFPIEKAHEADFYNCICPVCGKKFHLKPCKIKRAKTNYCSRDCFRIAKKEYMKGDGNHQYGLKGNKNASWKHDTRISGYGYVEVRCLDHPFRNKSDYVFEHRLIAEKYLLDKENSIEIDGKYYLSPEYEIHHKNFIKTDNRKENLCVMTKAKHQALHSRLNPRHRDQKNGRFVKDNVWTVKRTSEEYEVPNVQNNSCDVFCKEDTPVTIKPEETKRIDVGLALSISKGFVAAVVATKEMCDRFGMSNRYQIGFYDSKDEGGVELYLTNNTDTNKSIFPNEMIGSLVVAKAYTPELEIVSVM